MEDVINTKLSRLLKADLFDALTELQRQNELELSLQALGLQIYAKRRMVRARYKVIPWDDYDDGKEQND